MSKIGSKNKSVLYLSYDGLTDPLGQSQLLPYLIGLCKEGYHFHIVSFEKPGNYSEAKNMIAGIIKYENITWYPRIYHKQPPVFSTLLDLSQMYGIAKKLIYKHQIHLVHCRSYPPGLIGLKLKKEMGTKFLFDIRGFWANERVDGGLWNLENPLYRIIYNYFKRKEIEMMSTADHIVSLTNAGKEEIVSGRLFEGSYQAIPEEKVTVIPCAVDLGLFDPSKIDQVQKAALRTKLGLDDAEEVFVYLGSLGTWYLLDEMLIYFKNELEEKPASRFLFLSKENPEEIHNAADRLGVARELLVITSTVRSQVPLHLSVATKGIFFIKPAYSKKASSAVKMGEMMAMELDIVCNEIGDISNFNPKPVQDEKFKSLRLVELAKGQDLFAYSLVSALANYKNCYLQLR